MPERSPPGFPLGDSAALGNGKERRCNRIVTGARFPALSAFGELPVARRIGVTEQTFYRWRSEYGGLEVTRLPGAGSSSLDTAIRAEAGGG